MIFGIYYDDDFLEYIMMMIFGIYYDDEFFSTSSSSLSTFSDMDCDLRRFLSTDYDHDH